MIRRPPRSTQSRSSAASDVYKRQTLELTTSKPEEKEEPIPKKVKPTPEASTVVLCSRCKVECGIPVSYEEFENSFKFHPKADPASRSPPCLLYTSDAADDLLCVDLG